MISRMQQNKTRQIMIVLGAGLLGLVLNALPLPVIGNIHFRLGGLLAVQLAIECGPWCGLIAALVASLGGGLTNLPIALPITGAEVLVIGYGFRRKIPPIMSSFAYWAILGVPCLA